MIEIHVIEKYRTLRAQILEQTTLDFYHEFPEHQDNLRLTEITEDALSAQLQWPQPVDLNRFIGWDWRLARDTYRRDFVARLEVAVWHNENLCGLMLGKASEGKLVVKINYLQGLPADNPFKGYVVPIASRCAELFAVAIEADWIGIQDPLDDPSLIAYYNELGFSLPDPFDPRNNALFKRIVAEID